MLPCVGYLGSVNKTEQNEEYKRQELSTSGLMLFSSQELKNKKKQIFYSSSGRYPPDFFVNNE